MDIDTGFDCDRLLSLNQAKLVARSRINSLGSYEITINYNKITSGSKEECLEWLEANRLTVIDPTISFKTYDGEWNCVSIAYNEDRNIIQQTFKIDSQVGDLGDSDIDYGLQTGDLSRISDGIQIERAYYWRVVNPETVELPSVARNGEIWTKTANDNGDGTYDVIVSREIAQNLTANGESNSDSYTETVIVYTNTTEKSFVSSSFGDMSVPDAVVGEIKRIENTPKENGKFNSRVITRTAIAQRIPATSEGPPGYIAWPSDYSNAGGSFDPDGGRLIIGKNQSVSNFYTDIALLDGRFINTVSCSINDYGLIDYSIRSSV